MKYSKHKAFCLCLAWWFHSQSEVFHKEPAENRSCQLVFYIFESHFFPPSVSLYLSSLVPFSAETLQTGSMTPAQQGCARWTKEGLCNCTEAATGLTGLRAFYVPNNKKKEMTLQKLFKWPQVRSGMAARSAGLWSQLCHDFPFTQHQGLHRIARCHSTPKLWISHWCLTSHHLCAAS